MRIGTNIRALQAFNSLAVNNKKIQKTNLKMSTGLKINSAGDDPSALSVVSLLDMQVSGYEKAHQNSSHAISLIQTADGALNTIHEMLQRMRELSVQAVNDTNSDEDREKIQEEIEQIKSEIDDTIQKADYNGIRILAGDATALQYKYTNTQTPTKTTLKFGSQTLGDLPDSNLRGDISFTVKDLLTGTESGPVAVTITGTETSYAQILAKFNAVSTNPSCNLTQNQDGIEVSQTGSNYKLVISGDDFLLDALGFSSYSGAEYIRGLDQGINIITKPEDLRSPLSDEAMIKNNNDGTYTITDNKFSTGFAFTSVVTPDHSLGYGDVALFGDISTRPFVIQTGSHQHIEVDISIDKISTNILGIDWLNLTSVESASKAISMIDKALSEVSNIRAQVGAYQNRLEYTLNTLDVAKDTLTKSLSRYMDTDMAIEMTEYTRQNVTIQAAISVIAQANQRPAEILSLLRK